MKTKPTRHKEKNTFRFQTFNERVGAIDIDVFHRVRHDFALSPDEADTFFYETLEKWISLNCTESFNAFRMELGSDIETLAQLILQKDKVVDVLLKYLEAKDVLCLQPVLELVVALARDLQKEFYPYFPKFFKCIVDLLSTQDADQLEWSFTSLSYLFKYLWRYLTKNIGATYECYSPLLGGKRPEYIKNFAAESFSFLVRKVKDKKAFLCLVFDNLERHPDGIAGVGRLLFEAMKGVSGQFHAWSESFLPFLLHALNGEVVPQKLLYEALTHTVNSLASYIKPRNIELFWKASHETLDTFVNEWNNDQTETNAENIYLLLKLLEQVMSHKQAVHITQPLPLVQKLVSLLEQNFPKNVFEILIDISAQVFLFLSSQLVQEHLSRLLDKVLGTPYPELIFGFAEKLFDHPSFEAYMVPQLLQYCDKLLCTLVGLPANSMDVFSFLTKLILHKAPMCRTGLDLQHWSPYVLEFSFALKRRPAQLSDVQSIPDLLVSFTNTAESSFSSEFEQLLCTAVCLPHVKPIDKKIVLNNLRNMILTLCENILNLDPGHIKDTSGSSDAQEETQSNSGDVILKQSKLLFLLCLLVETVIHMYEETDLHVFIDLETITEVGLLCSSVPQLTVCALRMVDLCLSAVHLRQKNVLTADLLEALYTKLGDKLSSPLHEVRLLVAHIFSLFEVQLPLSSEGMENPSVFEICLAAEAVPLTLHEYREKLKFLQKLDYEFVQTSLPVNGMYNKVPLQFLLGQLYVNFQLLWNPCIKLIETHARGMKFSEFWKVFGPQLHMASKIAKKETESQDDFKVVEVSSCQYFMELNNDLHSSKKTPHHANYRILLWKALAEFALICEQRNKELVALFLSFLREEYYKKDLSLAPSCNVQKYDSVIQNSLEDSMLDSTENIVIDEEPTEVNEEPVQVIKLKKTSHEKHYPKLTSKTLTTCLELFEKFRNPNEKHKDLYETYLQLLCHRKNDIQKLVLGCLMTYKNNHLLAYKDHLFKLLDDKSFKYATTLFKVNKESDVIKSEHRQEVLPIVMRMLYGKIQSRTPSSGRGTLYEKRAVLLRFLAGCHEDELKLFLEMAFRQYIPFLKDDVMEMVLSIKSSIDLTSVIPFKVLEGALNMIGLIFSKFGNLMDKLLVFLLHLLLCICSMVVGLCEKKDEIYKGYRRALRNLRSLCIQRVTQFFSQFEKYQWTAEEIDAVFHVAVWPYLEILPVEGMCSPTALLKLFMQWSENPRYFVLFSKYLEGNKQFSSLPYIMKLLLESHTQEPVSGAILDITEKLLTFQNYEETNDDEGMKPPPIPVNCCLTVDVEYLAILKLSESPNFGSLLLVPHVSAVLQHLQGQLGKLKKNAAAQERALNVLSRISELVRDPAQSSSLLDLLLPLLFAKNQGADQTVVCLLTTVKNLIRNVDSPGKYVRVMSPLFGTISGRNPRNALCNVLETIGSISTEFEQMARVITDLNSWDKKHFEEPDYNLRLEAFHKLQEIFKLDPTQVDFGLLTVYNCFYFIKNEKDHSLLDNATYCFRTLAPAISLGLNKFPEERRLFLNSTVLQLVRKGMRDKSESSRHEFISILGALVYECADLHPILRDLSKLAVKTDPEVDFFENIRHLQIHRRTKALTKFCTHVQENSKVASANTLTQFLLPLASSFLCSEQYAKNNGLVDKAIEAVGVICRCLPWYEYQMILQFYLSQLPKQLTYQKQLIRIIVAILDSFHFDLSKAPDVQNLTEDPAKGVKTVTEARTEGEELFTDDATKGMENLDSFLDTVEEGKPRLDAEAVQSFGKTKILLTANAAARVFHIITKNLLPKLHDSLIQRSRNDMRHKSNRDNDNEDEEVLRVPLALAMVKLLQNLPQKMLDQNLPGILMKICTFLKSRLESVRTTARETLQKIMQALGPKYLSYLFRELRTLLIKGFQVHVLSYTIHSVLVAVKDQVKAGDMDCCVQSILEVCKMDLFGQLSEEKEVSKLTVKWKEAKTNRSYEMFNILAQFITEKCLTDLILPLKQMLNETHSFKTVRKISECFRMVVLGLADNKFISRESLVIFLFGIMSQSIPELSKESAKKKKQSADPSRLATDSYIIMQEPKRSGIVPKISKKTNAHILIEFSLSLYHTLLKREKRELSREECLPMMDPIVPMLVEFLDSQHLQLTILSLRCLCWVLNIDMPSVHTHIKSITSSIMKLLHKYASVGMGRGENFDLVTAAFKAITVLVRDVKFHTIDTDQLKVLLIYAENDIHDHTRQATGFGLLKAILSRKLVAHEINDVMRKVAQLSITSEMPYIRDQSRQVVLQYLMDYPLGRKLYRHIEFYLAQLTFDLETGRLSALQMLHMIIKNFPQNMMSNYADILFVTLGARLVNDELPSCRKMVAQCLKSMLGRLERNDRDKLFDVLVVWFQDKKLNHRRLAAQLCGIFVSVEKDAFISRLATLLPLLLVQFNPQMGGDDAGKFVRLKPQETSDPEEEEEKKKDYHLFQTLQLLLKLCVNVPVVLKGKEWQVDMESIWENVQALLLHPHEWVRLSAAQLLGQHFSSLDPVKIAEAAEGTNVEDSGFLFTNTRNKLRSLVFQMCSQLRPETTGAEMIDQVIKNLVFLARVIKNISVSNTSTNNSMDADDLNEDEETKVNVSLLWMIRRMRRIVNIEISDTPRSTAMRTAVFKWIGAVAVDIGKEELPQYLYHMLAPVVRELTDKFGNEDLKKLAQEVCDLIKGLVGMEVYSTYYAKIRTRLSDRRAERKSQKAQLIMTDPEVAAKRKIQKQQGKKEMKKRKLSTIKGQVHKKKKTSVDSLDF